MSEYDDLLKILLEKKPEMNKEQIQNLIKQKKEKIGAGYLTDQGALFLIAADLGVSLAETPKTELKLKDLYVGAKEVSVETRVMNFSPTRQFSRKDGSPVFLRTMTVYDNDSKVNVKLWDDKAKLPVIENLKPGDLIKIIKAYVKSDLNGAPTLNLGSGSNIESVEDSSNIPEINSLIVDVSLMKENQQDLVVSGAMDGPITTMSFTNSRGLPGKALRLRLKGNDNKSVGVVLWGQDEAHLPKNIPSGAKVKLFGVKTKTGNQGLELHGNESTIIDVIGQKETEPITLRIISISKSNSGNRLIIGADSEKNLLNLTDLSQSTVQFNEDDIVECMPSKVYGNSVTIDENSFVRKLDDKKNIPSKSDLRTKIADIKVGRNYCIEAIILKKPERRDIQTKTGENILLSEMFVEDETGQIWIKGWRDQAKIIDECLIGEIVSIRGVTAKSGLEGRVELSLTPFTTIIKKN